jgi:pilus assembly protein Flp/PilA
MRTLAMPKVAVPLKRLFADQAGATSIEYGLICAMIALAMIAAVGMTGDSLVAKFSSLLSLFP